jgi:iron complex outermembrane receptor protein
MRRRDCIWSGRGFLPGRHLPLGTLTRAARLLALILAALAAALPPICQANAPEVATPPPDTAPPRLEDLMKMTIPVPVVEAPSRYEQKTTEAPASVTVVTASQIQRYGYRTLADILRSVPGMHVTYDRNYHFLGVRGLSLGDNNNRVLLLVDGHRVNNSVKDGAAIGTDFILDVDLIEQVEISRGPGSSVYGNNAFFGVINVVTRRGGKIKGVEGSGEVASFDSYKGRVTYGNTFKSGLDVVLSGSVFDSAGPVHNGVKRLDDDGYGSFFGAVRFKGLTLEGAFIEREKGNPTDSNTLNPRDRTLRTTDSRSYVVGRLEHEFPGDLDVTAQLYYDRHDFLLGQPFVDLLSGQPTLFSLSENVQVGEWWGAELQARMRLFDRHVLIAGAEYRDDFRQEIENRVIFSRNPTTSGSSTNRVVQSYGLYVQGDFAILTNLHFSAGVRYDRYGDLDPTSNPRLALIYNPVAQTTFKAIYGTAFRAPSLQDYRLAFLTPQLEPERIATYELVYEQGIGRYFRSSVAGFLNRIDGLITFPNDGTVVDVKNVDVEARGVELALEAVSPGGIRGRASYTLQRAEDRLTGQVLTDSPRQLAKLRLSGPLYKEHVFLGAEWLYTSRRTTTRNDPLLHRTVPGTDARGYSTLNLTLFSQDLPKGMELSVSVYNLLDERYGDPSTPLHREDIIPQDGRTFRVKLTCRY